MAEAIEVLKMGTVVEASFDNDLHPFERDGVEVIEWMIDHRVFPHLVAVHTDNDIASKTMCGLLERSGYRGVAGRPRCYIKVVEPDVREGKLVALAQEERPRTIERLR